MHVLKPEIDALNEKYKDKDPMEKQRAQMDLYKRTGVSPLGGCFNAFSNTNFICFIQIFPSFYTVGQEVFCGQMIYQHMIRGLLVNLV